MEKYIVIEIQVNADGGVGTLVNAYDSYNTAQQQYHTILAAAAVSELPVHSAVVLDVTGELIDHQAFVRGTGGSLEYD